MQLRVVLVGLLVVLSGCTKNAHVTLGGTDLCFPKRYIPQFNAYIWLVTKDLPKSSDTLIFIPASEVKAAIPAYVVSHPNQYTSAVMHDLRIIASESSGRYAELKKEAWNIHESHEPYFVDQDAPTGYTRIHVGFDRPTFMWHMTTTPPPSKAVGEPPTGWYVGSCLEEPGSYGCKQLVESGGVRLWFDVDASNLKLREQVGEYAKKRLKEWVDACEG
jgi:hypothetical protein